MVFEDIVVDGDGDVADAAKDKEFDPLLAIVVVWKRQLLIPSRLVVVIVVIGVPPSEAAETTDAAAAAIPTAAAFPFCPFFFLPPCLTGLLGFEAVAESLPVSTADSISRKDWRLSLDCDSGCCCGCCCWS